MKRADFKKILKPLIKQTVKEVILEEGILSGIITEVVKGLNSNVVMETKKNKNSEKEDLEERYERDRQERIRRLNESAKVKADVFENVPEITDSQPGSPLAGVASNDSGVDISGILNIVDEKWKQMI